MPCTHLREGHFAVKLLRWTVLSASPLQSPCAKCGLPFLFADHLLRVRNQNGLLLLFRQEPS